MKGGGGGDHDVGVVYGPAVQGGGVAVKVVVCDVSSGGASKDGTPIGGHAVISKVGADDVPGRVLHDATSAYAIMEVAATGTSGLPS